jgi:hypothetical protein
MSEDNEYILVATKKGLVDTFMLTLKPIIYNGIISIYTDTCKHAEKTHTYDIPRQFQINLRNIQNWNNMMTTDETDRVKKELNQYYNLDSMISAIIVVQVRILSLVRGKRDTELKIKIPKGEDFIHKVYIKIGEKIYCTRDILDNIKYHDQDAKIRSDLLDIIGESITETLTSYVPIGDILNDYIGSLFNKSDEEYVSKGGRFVHKEECGESDSDDEHNFGQETVPVAIPEPNPAGVINEDLVFPVSDPNVIVNDLHNEELLKFDDFYNDGSGDIGGSGNSFGAEPVSESTDQLAKQTDDLISELGEVTKEPVNFFEPVTPHSHLQYPHQPQPPPQQQTNPYASSLDDIPEQDPTSGISDIPTF